MATVPEAAVTHYGRMQGIQLATVAVGRRAWLNVNPERLSASWADLITVIAPAVAARQIQAATAGASYGASTLAQQGQYVAPDAFVNPEAWGGGYAPDGRDLDSLLYSPVTTAKTALAEGATLTAALAAGRNALDSIVRTVIADSGRQAAGVDTAARAGV